MNLAYLLPVEFPFNNSRSEKTQGYVKKTITECLYITWQKQTESMRLLSDYFFATFDIYSFSNSKRFCLRDLMRLAGFPK